VAKGESAIEAMRIAFGGVRDFIPRQLHDHLNVDNDRLIKPEEMNKFTEDNFISGASVETCAAIIQEYDQDGDGALSYDEFLNMILSASSSEMRNYVLYRKKRGMGVDTITPLGKESISFFTRILNLEKEIVITKQKVY
jgi:hypothetical protein